jgi:predicted nucleic acid-binding protein
MSAYTLDACALLALAYQETGSEIIADIYNRAEKHEALLVMHRINLLEAYTVIANNQGENDAADFYLRTTSSPIRIYDTLTSEFFSIFQQYRNTHSMPFADTFVVATNAIHNPGGTIVTADLDFKKIAQNTNIPVMFFR